MRFDDNWMQQGRGPSAGLYTPKLIRILASDLGTGVTAPGNAALEVIGKVADEDTYEVGIPLGDSLSAVVFNLGHMLVDGEYAWAVLDQQPILAAYDPAGTVPVVGEQCGTVTESFLLDGDYTGFDVLGVDTDAKLCWVARSARPMTLQLWQATSDAAAGVILGKRVGDDLVVFGDEYEFVVPE